MIVPGSNQNVWLSSTTCKPPETTDSETWLAGQAELVDVEFRYAGGHIALAVVFGRHLRSALLPSPITNALLYVDQYD